MLLRGTLCKDTVTRHVCIQWITPRYTTLLHSLLLLLILLIGLFNLPVVNAFPRCSPGDKSLSRWYIEPKQNESQMQVRGQIYISLKHRHTLTQAQLPKSNEAWRSNLVRCLHCGFRKWKETGEKKLFLFLQTHQCSGSRRVKGLSVWCQDINILRATAKCRQASILITCFIQNGLDVAGKSSRPVWKGCTNAPKETRRLIEINVKLMQHKLKISIRREDRKQRKKEGSNQASRRVVEMWKTCVMCVCVCGPGDKSTCQMVY